MVSYNSKYIHLDLLFILISIVFKDSFWTAEVRIVICLFVLVKQQKKSKWFIEELDSFLIITSPSSSELGRCDVHVGEWERRQTWDWKWKTIEIPYYCAKYESSSDFSGIPSFCWDYFARESYDMGKRNIRIIR